MVLAPSHQLRLQDCLPGWLRHQDISGVHKVRLTTAQQAYSVWLVANDSQLSLEYHDFSTPTERREGRYRGQRRLVSPLYCPSRLANQAEAQQGDHRNSRSTSSRTADTLGETEPSPLQNTMTMA
jgi:hypothetical protein